MPWRRAWLRTSSCSRTAEGGRTAAAQRAVLDQGEGRSSKFHQGHKAQSTSRDGWRRGSGSLESGVSNSPNGWFVAVVQRLYRNWMHVNRTVEDNGLGRSIELVISVLVAFAINGGTAMAAELPRFDPRSDAARAEACLATYMTLGRATVGLEPQSDVDALQMEGGRGTKRLEPFVDQATGVVGENKFYHDAVGSRLIEQRILTGRIPNEVRSLLAHRLASDAADCDRQLDAWGAPKLCFYSNTWHVC